MAKQGISSNGQTNNHIYKCIQIEVVRFKVSKHIFLEAGKLLPEIKVQERIQIVLSVKVVHGFAQNALW